MTSAPSEAAKSPIPMTSTRMCAVLLPNISTPYSKFKTLKAYTIKLSEETLRAAVSSHFRAISRAYMWWNIAASKGNTDAVAGRTAVQNVMTPAQIEKAQQLTSECVANNYKDC
jgi:hypothetical protein